MTRLLQLVLFSATLSGCSLLKDPPPPPAPPPAPKLPDLRIFDVELRQKTNSCGPLDGQIAKDTFALLELEQTAVIYAGTDRTFAVSRQKEDKRTLLKGTLTEPNFAKKGKKRVLCRRITEVELEQQGDRLSGTYVRNNAQGCMAKGCSVAFEVSGRLR